MLDPDRYLRGPAPAPATGRWVDNRQLLELDRLHQAARQAASWADDPAHIRPEMRAALQHLRTILADVEQIPDTPGNP